jgi:hypothetical protein
MPRRRPVRARAAVALGALALLVGAAGCGTSDEDKVRDTLATFEKATAAHDYKTLCTRVLAKPLVQRLSNVGLPCEVALQRGLAGVTSPQLTVLRVKVRGDVALAVVRSAAAGQPTSRDTIRLVREGDDWRVSTLSGAQPPRPSGES